MMLNKFEIKYVKLIFNPTDPKDHVRYYHGGSVVCYP